MINLLIFSLKTIACALMTFSKFVDAHDEKERRIASSFMRFRSFSQPEKNLISKPEWFPERRISKLSKAVKILETRRVLKRRQEIVFAIENRKSESTNQISHLQGNYLSLWHFLWEKHWYFNDFFSFSFFWKDWQLFVCFHNFKFSIIMSMQFR